MKLMYASIKPLIWFILLSLFITSCSNDENGPSEDKLLLPVLITNISNINQVFLEVHSGEYLQNVYVNPEEITIIEINLASSRKFGEFITLVLQTNQGFVEKKISFDSVEQYSETNPIVLDFNNNNSEIVFSYDVNTGSGKHIDLIVSLFNTEIYQIDWGDGQKEIKRKPKYDDTIFQSDFVNHNYDEIGIFTIKVSAYDFNEVKSVIINSNVFSPPVTITSLSIEGLTSLEVFSMGRNNILNPNFLNSFKNLKEINFRFGRLREIDLTENVNLEKIHIKSTGFEQIIGLQNLKNLKWLSLNKYYHPLDFSKFPELETLRFVDCNISEINLTSNFNLQDLWLQDNQITNIDLTNNSNIWRLLLSNNLLTSIDVSVLPSLEFLSLSDNSLSAIDLSKNDMIKTLGISKNDMTFIDISNLNFLESLGLSMPGLVEVKYPDNFNNVEFLFFKESYDLSFREPLDLLYKSQEDNPRRGVKIVFPENENLSIEDLEKLQLLEAEYDWEITI